MHATQPAAGVDGWTERSSLLAGQPARWLERPKPGESGTVEQVYLDSPLVERSSARPVGLREARIQLSPSARETILHHAYWQSSVDRRETGGWLYGDSNGTVVVAHATGPGNRATRGTHSLTLDHSAFAQFDLQRMWGEPLTCRIGRWETHPGGPAEPSRVDLDGWSAGLDVINRDSPQPYYVAIIATDEQRSWDLHAWLVHRAETGRTVVERVQLEDLDARAA